MTPWTTDEIAALIAEDIPDGAYVNLGIGQPVKVANYIPDGREVVLHSENGILGMGPTPPDDRIDHDLINAGKQPVTLLEGGAFFHHADSFAMIRGGHIDVCVLGAYQVAANGDLANWSTGKPDDIPGVGGAMDLAAGAKKIVVMMTHTTRQGGHKLVEEISYPATARGGQQGLHGSGRAGCRRWFIPSRRHGARCDASIIARTYGCDGSRLDIEENCLFRPLKVDVEAIDAIAFGLREEGRDAVLVFQLRKDRVFGIGRFFVCKVDAGVQADIDSTGNDPGRDVWRLKAAVDPAPGPV